MRIYQELQSVLNAFITLGNKEFAVAALNYLTPILISRVMEQSLPMLMLLYLLGLGGFVVGSSATLQLTATQSHTVPISGTGNMTVTGLENKTNADLSGITQSGTNTVNAGSTTFSGSFLQTFLH